MNFLSHYYFERNTESSDEVLGTVLPDLVKNTDKSWRIFPEKNPGEYLAEPDLMPIFRGWKRHLEVDNFFHSSLFFKEHARRLRIAIQPVLKNSPARPFFIAHIALELMLDNLLLQANIIDTKDFYSHLHNSSRVNLRQFLVLNKLPDTRLFFNFFDEFIDAAYLNSYRESQHILYALNRICMRIWARPFTENEQIRLGEILMRYREELQKDFMYIFEQIDTHLQ